MVFLSHGRAKAVMEKVRPELERITCKEPEQAIKAKVIEIIEASLVAFPPELPVKVSASGSQGTDDKRPEFAANQLAVTIEPLWGFVE